MNKIYGLPRPWWRRAKKANQHEPFSMPFYGVWEAVARFAAEIRVSDFMAEMTRRCRAYGTQGLMSGVGWAAVDALAATGSSHRVGWICWDVLGLYLESVGG